MILNRLTKSLIVHSVPIQTLIERVFFWLMRVRYQRLDVLSFHELLKLLTPNTSSVSSFRRVGSRNDGGYVISNLPQRYSTLISFGVGDNIDFELEMSDSIEVCQLYDHTVPAMPKSFPKGFFHQIGLSDTSSSSFVCLKDIMKDYPEDTNLFLKIDIEGGEWTALNSTHEVFLSQFSQIVVEFHSLHSIYNSKTLDLYISVLKKLQINHDLITIHGNNWSHYSVIRGVPIPDTIEVTFLRRDFISSGNNGDRNCDLDFHSPNNPEADELVLLFGVPIIHFRK